MDLQIRFTGYGLSADLARDLIFPCVYLEMYFQCGLPIALEIAHIALVLLPFAVGLHVHVQVSSARVRRVANFTDERFLACVRQQMSLESLIRVETLAADLAVGHVFLIVFFLVQPQIVSGHLRDAADIASETFIVLLQVRLQEFLRLEAFAAENTLKWFLLLVHLYHVLPQFVLLEEDFVALVAAAGDFLHVPLVVLSVLQELQLLAHPFAADVALVDHRALPIRLAFRAIWFSRLLRGVRLGLDF